MDVGYIPFHLQYVFYQLHFSADLCFQTSCFVALALTGVVGYGGERGLTLRGGGGYNSFPSVDLRTTSYAPMILVKKYHAKMGPAVQQFYVFCIVEAPSTTRKTASSGSS
jgi:hypothetical protein